VVYDANLILAQENNVERGQSILKSARILTSLTLTGGPLYCLARAVFCRRAGTGIARISKSVVSCPLLLVSKRTSS